MSLIGHVYQRSSRFEWKIENSLSLQKTTAPFESAQFRCCDINWNICMRPMAIKRDSSVKTSMHLSYKNAQNPSSMTIEASAKYGKENFFISEPQKRDFPVNTKREMLLLSKDIDEDKEYMAMQLSMPNENLTISMFMLNRSGAPETITREAYSKDEIYPDMSQKILIGNFKELLDNGSHSDVTIKTKDKEFPVHKGILGVRSAVFKTIFEQDVSRNSIVIDNYDSEIVGDLLYFIYCGEVKEITSDNVFDLYDISNKYQVKDLAGDCSMFMKRMLTTKNMANIILLADKHKDQELIKLISRLFARKRSTILESDEWAKFETKHTHLSNVIFRTIILDNSCKIKM